MLELVGVVVAAGGVDRLNRCSLVVRPGEVLGVVGPTGAGKSTLLSVIAGQERPTRGRLTWEGRDLTRSPDRLRALAALAPHDLPGPHDLTAHAWLSLWAELDGAPGRILREHLDGALSRFNLGGLSGRAVSTLSRGERRRLAWARAWVRQPRILLLDGPDDGVDGTCLRSLAAAVKESAAAGATVILTSSAPHVPTTLCDRVAVLRSGAVALEIGRSDAAFAATVASAQGWSS